MTLSRAYGKLALVAVLLTGLAFGSVQAETRCQVCTMKLSAQMRQHFILHHRDADKKPMHVCSKGCIHKIQKYDANYATVKVVDFHRPSDILDGDKAYFLVGSTKIEADLNGRAMPPYIVAFKSLVLAQAAQKKYGEGRVVLGVKKALQ